MSAVTDHERGEGARPVGLGPFFAGIWLFYLIDPVVAGWQLPDRVRGLAGVLCTVAFGVVYMLLWWRTRRHRHEAMASGSSVGLSLAHRVTVLALLAVLGAAMVALLGEPGIACSVYVAVVGVLCFPLRVAGPLAVVIVGVVLVLGAALDWGSQVGTAFGVIAASLAIFGLRAMLNRNVELVQAHAVNARLAVDNERNRFARDLHDILGHSLTVITVKAELANRLLDVDPDRARAELADLERLSRDALADVRRAVDGYRDLTLPGELARARVALLAADIDADLPNSTDEVPSELRELFAWTVREGVTNVIRHSGATRCTVRLDPGAVEVRDDGAGPGSAGVCGNGLAGLRERATARGAVLVTAPADPRGFRLQVLAR